MILLYQVPSPVTALLLYRRIGNTTSNIPLPWRDSEYGYRGQTIISKQRAKRVTEREFCRHDSAFRLFASRNALLALSSLMSFYRICCQSVLGLFVLHLPHLCKYDFAEDRSFSGLA